MPQLWQGQQGMGCAEHQSLLEDLTGILRLCETWTHKSDPNISLAGHRRRKRTSPGFKNIMSLKSQPGSRGICALDDSVG